MAGIFANDTQNSVPLDNAAIDANAFNCWFDFHSVHSLYDAGSTLLLSTVKGEKRAKPTPNRRNRREGGICNTYSVSRNMRFTEFL